LMNLPMLPIGYAVIITSAEPLLITKE